ncbi:hypothetical protein PWT90_04162 [Aphanocladium album]|nr:hypothetical protein PWT90_04162 [Aphanocladium album]
MIAQRLATRVTAAAQTTKPSIFRALAAHRTTTTCPYSTQPPHAYPTVTDKGFWKSLVPKPLRRENRPRRRGGKKAKEWNPVTYFIVMFLFVGSMSIQMIALRNQTSRYMRQASVRLQLLREVVERIQNGEDVDVETELGTGDEKKEADWEEVLQAIEKEEALRKSAPKESTKPKTERAPQATQAQAATTPAQTSEQASTKSTGFGSFF